MLRVLVLVAALLAFTAALIIAMLVPLQWPLLIWTGVPLAGILFERARYGIAQARPRSGGWRETRERFVDDASGRVMVVWYDPSTGKRRYVDLEQRPVDPANELQ